MCERERERLRSRKRQRERKSKNGMFLSPTTISETNLTNARSQVFRLLVINVSNNVSGNSPISLRQVVTRLQPLVFHSSNLQRQGSQSHVKRWLTILSTAWSSGNITRSKWSIICRPQSLHFTCLFLSLAEIFSGKFITMYAIQNQCF